MHDVKSVLCYAMTAISSGLHRSTLSFSCADHIYNRGIEYPTQHNILLPNCKLQACQAVLQIST